MGRMENMLHISGSLRLRKLGSEYHWWCSRKYWILVCSLKALLRMPVVTGFSFCINKIVKCECKWEFKSISRSTKPDKECKLKIRIKLEFCMVHFTVKFKQWLDTFTSKMQICSYFWNTVNVFNEFMSVLFFLLSSHCCWTKSWEQLRNLAWGCVAMVQFFFPWGDAACGIAE